MALRVTGKNLDIGDVLRNQAEEKINEAVAKYADGGYSGHGVMLSNYVGKLYAETVAGNRDRLKLLEELKVPAFPGGRTFRAPLLFLALSWYALMDRI